jgi:hypothetical protein
MTLFKFRNAWDTAGYGTRMASSNVVPPPPHDYIRAYYLTSAEYAISNIALGRIKVSRFSDLNDPFELLSPNFREKRVRRIIRQFKNEVDKSTGLLCFSSNWTNPVLWSHYGDRHRGLCLGFDLRRTLADPVTYSADRLVADLADDTDGTMLDPVLRKALITTKFAHWSYEEELRRTVSLRAAVPEGNHFFLPFDDDDLVLAEVVLGAHCSLPLSQVRAFVSERFPRVSTYCSRLAFKFFEVVPEENSVHSLHLLQIERSA